MDHERKIASESGFGTDKSRSLESIESTKAFFLRELIEEYKSNKDNYVLETEFAKTKKNRNFLVAGVCLFVVAAFISIAILINNNIEKENNQVSIKASEFESINLRDILEKANTIQGEINQLNIELSLAQKNLDLDLGKIRQSNEQELSLARSRYLDQVRLDKEVETLNRRFAARSQTSSRAANPAIVELRQKIAESEQALAKIDQNKLTLARQQEVIINAERTLNDKEKQRLIDAYESRYNSLVRDTDVRDQRQQSFMLNLEKSYAETIQQQIDRLTSLYNPSVADTELLSFLQRELTRPSNGISLAPQYYEAGLVVREETEQINAVIAGYRRLLTVLKQTPYVNDVPAVLSQLESRFFEVLNSTTISFDRFWKAIEARNSLISELKSKNESFAQRSSSYQGALDEYLRINAINAFLIEAQSERLLIYPKKEYKLDKGSIMLVLRKQANGNQYQNVAEIQVDELNQEGFYPATLTRPLRLGVSLQKFDVVAKVGELPVLPVR